VTGQLHRAEFKCNHTRQCDVIRVEIYKVPSRGAVVER